MVPAVVFIIGGLEEMKENKQQVRDCARCTRSSTIGLEKQNRTKEQEILYPVCSVPGVPEETVRKTSGILGRCLRNCLYWGPFTIKPLRNIIY